MSTPRIDAQSNAWFRPVLRDVLIPGIVGLTLHAVNLKEVGLPIAPAIPISTAFLERGLTGVVLASLCLGLVSKRAWVAWASFFLPTYTIRTALGATMVIQGTGNIWPLMFAGDTLFGVIALIFFYLGRSAVRLARN